MLRLFLLLLVLLSPAVFADNGAMSALQITTNPDGSQEYSVTLQVLAMMTALSFLPAMIIMMTCFTRFIIVLAILRQAIGLQQSPPNPVLIGVALCLTLLVMRPVGHRGLDRQPSS